MYSALRDRQFSCRSLLLIISPRENKWLKPTGSLLGSINLLAWLKQLWLLLKWYFFEITEIRGLNVSPPIVSYFDIPSIRQWDRANLVLNSIEKVKPGSLLALLCMFPKLNGTKFWSHSFHLQNLGILQTRMDQRGEPMKTKFDIFQIQKWISQTVWAQKVG